MAETRPVQYLVLPDAQNPYLLARVRWPDVFQAISPAQPYWLDDPGLFDLPYDPGGTTVTPGQASAIAMAWGVRLPAEDAEATTHPSFMRRMPADWSNLSRAEKRAWSIELVEASRPKSRALRRSRRRPQPDVIDLTGPNDAHLIDLTSARDDAPATREDV